MVYVKTIEVGWVGDPDPPMKGHYLIHGSPGKELWQQRTHHCIYHHHLPPFQARNVQGTKPPPLYFLGRSLSRLQLSIPTPLPSPWLLLLHTQMTLTALLGVLLSPVYFSIASYFSNMEVHLHFFLGTQHGTEVPHSYAGFVPVAFCHFLLCSSHTNDSLFDNDDIYSHMPIFTLLPPRLYCFSAILFPL